MTLESAFDKVTKEVPFPMEYFEFKDKTDPEHPEKTKGKYLKTGYAAKLIRSILALSSFEETDDIEEANLILGCTKGKLDIEQWNQRVNHYDFTFSLGSKAGYNNVMNEFKEKFGFIPSFYPETYHIPAEKEEMLKAFPSSKLWILKPGGGSRGNGIHVISEPPSCSGGKSYVVQKYIDDPMLINGLKFDLRFYVLVTSLVPLKIYLFNNGLVRLATEPYKECHDDIDNLSAHLTNFSINKESDKFKATNDMSEDGKGNKWTHAPFWPWLESQGYNVEEVRNKIEDAIAMTIIASRDKFLQQEEHRHSFELFGFDVMLTSKCDVYVIEVNVSPALGTSSTLDKYVKTPLVKDMFNLAMIPVPSIDGEIIDQIMRSSHREFPGRDLELIGTIAICEYEEGQKRLGGFKCIYPTAERVAKMSKFFSTETTEDKALEKWLSSTEEEKFVLLQKLYVHMFRCLADIEKEEEEDGDEEYSYGYSYGSYSSNEDEME